MAGIRQLRGPRRKALNVFIEDLANRGCAALGYRLTGADPLNRLCVKHLQGSDRAVVAFSADPPIAWLLLVGPHMDGDRATDVYRGLYELVDAEAPTGPRTKPSCCDETREPTIDAAVLEDLVARGRTFRRR